MIILYRLYLVFHWVRFCIILNFGSNPPAANLLLSLVNHHKWDLHDSDEKILNTFSSMVDNLLSRQPGICLLNHLFACFPTFPSSAPTLVTHANKYRWELLQREKQKPFWIKTFTMWSNSVFTALNEGWPSETDQPTGDGPHYLPNTKEEFHIRVGEDWGWQYLWYMDTLPYGGTKTSQFVFK